jgi:hypothetical protein
VIIIKYMQEKEAKKEGIPIHTFEHIMKLIKTCKAYSAPVFQKSFWTRDEDQLWFWTPAWQKKEEGATEDIKRGRLSRPISSKKELTSYLDSLVND